MELDSLYREHAPGPRHGLRALDAIPDQGRLAAAVADLEAQLGNVKSGSPHG